MSTDTQTASRFISVQEAASEISVSDQLIWKLIRNGKFPVKIVRLASVIRIDRKDWEAFLETGFEFTPAVRRGRKPKATPSIDLDNIKNLSVGVSHA